MEELKALFGDGTLDYATFEQKLAESKISLANLSEGGYVDKRKYDKLAGDFQKYKAENDTSKYADYDQIKAERDALAAEKATAEQLAKVRAAGVDEKFAKFVLSEVSALVTEKKDFDTALAEYVKANEQFAHKEEKQGFFTKGASAPSMQGSGDAQKTINQKMNNLLRGKN